MLERIKRGRTAIFETQSGAGLEEVTLTGPPRVDRENGDLLIGFRRPDNSLDVVAVCGPTEVERSISDHELVALVEGLRQAINECSTAENLRDVAERYAEYCDRNKLNSSIRRTILDHFPPEVRDHATGEGAQNGLQR